MSNTLPLIILLTVLNFFYPKKTLTVILFIILIGGTLVWLFAEVQTISALVGLYTV
ncbi:hypothetical protein PJW08_11440 [Tenacibaculum finnmarkense]|nr:hypothetical protein PJW08_11440 [Tenacibaculum finnmarkense]